MGTLSHFPRLGHEKPDGMSRMFESEEYELLDFGDQRRLERFHGVVVDRPCAAAYSARALGRPVWDKADARFERADSQRGVWSLSPSVPQAWSVTHGDITFELKCTEHGQVGLFAEQAKNWDWISQQVRRGPQPLRVLNLFAYTGGSTLAAAAAGASVVHVDAARNVVSWARRNAALSGLSDAPIRWIVDDAREFVARERRRGNQYHAVILDPPSYGHGPKGQAWQLNKDLMPLLRACAQLTAERRVFLLLTCHSPGYGPAELSATLADAMFGHCGAGVVARNLYLKTADGRRLPAGVMSRWPQ